MAHRGKFQRRNRFRQSYNRASNDKTRAHLPMQLVRLGRFSHACMEEAICQVLIEQVPYFNAFIYAANRQPIGKVDDIFGEMHEFSVSIRLNDPKVVKTFKQSDEFFIDEQKLLPMMRFLPKSKSIKNKAAKAKSKLHARNPFKDPGISVSGTMGGGGRASVGNDYRRGGGSRKLQYKCGSMYSNNF